MIREPAFTNGATVFGRGLGQGSTLSLSINVQSSDEVSVVIGINNTLHGSINTVTDNLGNQLRLVRSASNSATNVYAAIYRIRVSGFSGLYTVTVRYNASASFDSAVCIGSYRGNGGTPTNTSNNDFASTTPDLFWSGNGVNSALIMGCANSGLNILPTSNSATVRQSVSTGSDLNVALADQSSAGGGNLTETLTLSQSVAWATVGYEQFGEPITSVVPLRQRSHG